MNWLDGRAERLRAFGFASFPAFFLGGVIAMRFGVKAGLVTMFGVFLGVGGGAILFSDIVGGFVRAMTNPYGRRRPREHSRADALVQRGDPETAIAVLEASLEEFPDDPEALLRIARIRRRSLSDLPGAIEAFRKARASGLLSDYESRVSMREMLDIADELGDPARVAPDLARHRDAYEDSDEGRWAVEELAEIKRSIRR